METRFGANLNRFRYVGENNGRYAARLGVSQDRLKSLLLGELPTDAELISMAARLGVADYELFSGAVWPGAKVDTSCLRGMFNGPVRLNNVGV